MFSQNYSYYVFKIASAGLISLAGVLSIICLIAAVLILFRMSSASRARLPLFSSMILAALVLFAFGFNGATYRFDERPETLVIESLPSGKPDCGTAWSAFITSGFGMGNPCKKGCYRGRVINKEMRMRGFPPMPQYRRELECWTRDANDLPGFLD